jgi:hypothetical protein
MRIELIIFYHNERWWIAIDVNENLFHYENNSFSTEEEAKDFIENEIKKGEI